jgi:hypothetical protein
LLDYKTALQTHFYYYGKWTNIFRKWIW